ncbi:MAG: hypothetical protein R3Y05_03040 [bacterium]
MDILESQKNILEFLNNSKKQNRLSHAYMFEGSKGVGKLETALYFTCMLWCKEDEPCLKCDTCKQILNKQFLNLTYIYNDKKEILTDQINNLQKEFSSTAPLNGPRVYIIEDAHKMSVKLQNRLLKFIEEPEGNTYAILLTNSPDLIITTIKSRVISLTFKELSYDFLVKKLTELNVEDKYCNILPHIKNNVDKCIELLNDTEELKVINLVYKFIDKLNKKDILLFYKENQETLQASNLILFINLLQELYKDIYKVMINQEPQTFITIDYTKLKTIYKVSYISEIIKELVELEYKLRYNININLHVIKTLIALNGGDLS